MLNEIEGPLNGRYNGHPARLVYLARPDGSLSLAHGVQIGNVEANTLYEAFVDAHTGTLLSVTDFTSNAVVSLRAKTSMSLPDQLF